MLYGYESYVRILLCDLDYEQEYLVYEAYYPQNSINILYHIEDFAYESSMLYNLANVMVKLEIHNGECYLHRVSYSNTPYELDKTQFDKDKRQLKCTQDSSLLASLNQRLKDEDFLWVAGPTSVSELYYDQRKDMLPKNTENEIPNLQGLEYYKGGVFEVLTDSVQNRATYTSNYVDEFIWRNRHGENWLTPAKTQQCTHCWVFCPVSVAESSVNLYFNQHIDYNLSEQHVASCSGGNIGYCNRGYISSSVSFIANQGVVPESCFPYAGQDPPITPCGNVCNNPTEIVSFYSYSSVQKMLI
jgi:Pyruvate/2-oxoacid:ferredoxin oxidoreductase delta subunit